MCLGGDDGAMWNRQAILKGPTSTQGDALNVVLDDSVYVFLAMNGGDLPLSNGKGLAFIMKKDT